jgi:hypothetical protein
MGKKTLCDWDKKEIEKNLDKLIQIIENPRFICRKCARSAHIAHHLCKPVKIEKEK